MGKLIVFSGAGLSAESGISTFRDSNGLWENHNVTQICNISNWKRNRELVYKFYNERRMQLKEVEPNSIHKAFAELEKEVEVIHLTQNVDDLLERAGCKNVIHLHGELTKMMCTSCKVPVENPRFENEKEHPNWEVGYEEVDSDEIRCPHCNSNKGVKPFVVFFGEEAPNYIKKKEVFRDAIESDVIIVMGTMGNVVNIHADMQVTYGYKILNNLEESPYINDKLFDKVFYKKGTEAIEDIKTIVRQYLK